ncbi:FG-GAP repeat domain-containing protein [Streptomyces sp. NPDC050842]|uniref:FG-GAP repeat domain-containing protein n=1 Tax=Streptomyces sp. NPDC050842 TaxID=3365636 RepID=UPI0037B439C2
MNRTSTTRYRLVAAAAVAVALAVTAGGTAGAAPGHMATTGAVTADAGLSPQEDGVAPFPPDAAVVGSGPTGFLSAQSGDSQLTYRWTRYEDGVTTALPGTAYRTARRTDTVTQDLGNGVFRLQDMGTGADPSEIDVTPLGDGYSLAAYAGTDLVMKKANATGGTDLHVIGKPDGALVDHTVTGLPADAEIISVNVDSPDSAVVRYSGTVDGVKRSRAAVVDLAARTVVEEYETPDVPLGGTSLSATHIAWLEQPADSTVRVAVTRRDTGETVRHDLGVKESVTIQLVGDWLTYRQFGGSTTSLPNARRALYARSLATGETVKLLEHTMSSTPGADATLIARGGTLDRGEGLYQVSPGAPGARPVVTLVASTGEPTTLELVSHTVPGTIDFDRVTTPVPLRWTLSRQSTSVRVELVHTATRKTWRTGVSHYGGGTVGFSWKGAFESHNVSIPAVYTVPAPNGEYTWRLTAEPAGGVGPALEKTGTFKIVRKAVPHDFNDNGTPDLLVRNSSGELSLSNTSHPLGSWTAEPPKSLGGGWNTYDRLDSPGNVAGSPHADVVARDKSGVLWLYQGTGHALAPRARVGGGWGAYNRITGSSDLTGDGRSDLLAGDTSGVLWLYQGTGSTAAPFATRVKVGGGWGVYNHLTATGNIGGGPAGDLVARDENGVLWLYLGKGDGTFAARTRIGGGWSTYEGLTGFGDVDRDGHADLLANDNGATYYYKGTGDWRTPFEPRHSIYNYSRFDWNATVF